MDDEGTGDPEVDKYYSVGVGGVCTSSDVEIIGKDGKPQKPAAPVAGCELSTSPAEPNGFNSSTQRPEEPGHCTVLGLDLEAGCKKSFTTAATGVVGDMGKGSLGAALNVVGAVADTLPGTGRSKGGKPPGFENNLFEIGFSR